METSVDTLVYQLEDDDTNVRWNSLQKLRRIAAVETSHFPVRNTRRFLQCVRRRIVSDADPNIAIEALRLLGDVMVSLGDSVDQILSSILPHLISILPKTRKKQEHDGDSDGELDTLNEEMFQIFRKYTIVTNDLQAVADLLVNIGLGSGKGSVRETSLIVLMRLLDERFLKRSVASAIGRGDKALIVALVQAIIPAMEDTNENVVVAAEEAIAKLESYWGSRFYSDVMKFLSTQDKRTLQEHHEPIADFLQACTTSTSPPTSPLQSSQPASSSSAASRPSPSKVHPLVLTEELYFGFLKADIVTILTTYTSNSNADWKKRAAAVEKLYAACKEMDGGTLRGATAKERERRMDELDKLFDILVRLTQDVDVHLVKRALQITQILFRKLSPPRHKEDEASQNIYDANSKPSIKDAAFYMKKILSPIIETAANFVGDDDEMESFVYALLGQVFASGCVSVTSIEQVLASTPLRHRRSRIREEAVKVWIVLLLIAERESLLSESYAPNEFVVQTLGRLLGDSNVSVRDLAFEVAAVLAMVCCCNIYALLEMFTEDEYVSERVDWAALRARLRQTHIPELRSNCTLRIKPTTSSADKTRSNRLTSSVEKSLDSSSEMRVVVKPNHADENELRSEQGPTSVEINEKLSALRKKMDQTQQPRAKRTQRPHSEKAMATAKTERGNDYKTEPTMQMVPRAKSSPGQSANTSADDIESQSPCNETQLYQSLRGQRVHPNRIAVTLPVSEAFTTVPRQPSELSPQQLQSLQSDVHNNEDRPLKTKFIDRTRELKAEFSSHSSPDERPIRPMATSGDSDQIYLNIADQGSTGELDNNETQPIRKNKSERVVSLATRKRLEAKTKQDGQTCSNNSPRIRSPEETIVPENEPWDKPAKSKGTGDISRPGKVEPRYLEAHEITPIVNPKQDLSKVLSQLQSDDWEANFDALSTVRRLALHHASMIDGVKVHAIITGIMKQVRNLRSSVSKNALLALESMCAAFSRAIDPEVENIIPVLLKRCADSNSFVCESASASLQAVVLKCSTSRVVSALTSHASSKAVPIRREVARGIRALIVGQTNIQANKDLSSILQLVGRCLEDSNNEVRDIAKQSILHLCYKQRIPSELIKRFLSAPAQAKIGSVLSGEVAYSPQILPKSSSLTKFVSEQRSTSAAKKRETAAAPQTKKITKRASSRASPPTSSDGTRFKLNSDELHRLEAKLNSNNWKDRFDALNETTDFICSCASTLVESGQMLNLFDQLIKRLDDGNAKVNVLALECMETIVPAVGSGMGQVLPSLVPAITKNLANARTASLAQSVVQYLCIHADNRSLVQQLAIQSRSANSRVAPGLLDTLTHLTAQSLDDKSNYVLTRYVLPLALDMLKEAKSGVKEANLRLLRQLRRTLGPTAFSNAASKLSSAQQQKLAAVLR